MRWRLALLLAALAALSAAAPAFGVVAQASDKPVATISLRYTAPPSGSVARTVVLKALGPAPAASTTLVDEEGRRAVRARVQAALDPACGVAHIRDTGLGGDRWCLRLEDIRAGSEVTGKLSGSKSVVTLKVAARHGLRLPTAVAVLVLVLAAGFVLYTSNLMGERTNRLLVNAQLRRRSDVSGLREWVKEAKDYLTYARIRSLVGWMRERGKQRAMRARASLAAAEQKVSLDVLPECPLRAKARDVAASKEVSATDLVSFKGEILDHPARELEDTLQRAEALVKDFNGKVDAMLPLVPAPKKGTAKALIEKTRDALANLSDVNVDSTLAADLNKTIAQLWEYISAGGPAGMQAAGTGVTPERVTPTAKERFFEAADIVAASWPVVLAIAVLMIVATVAALSTSYATKRAFGTAWDYASLAVAVFGSTSVAGIVAAALLWRRTPAQT